MSCNKIGTPFRIALARFGVDGTVNLNDQSMLRATEIHNERTANELAAKFCSGELPIAQCLPEHRLRTRRTFAKRTCLLLEHRINLLRLIRYVCHAAISHIRVNIGIRTCRLLHVA